MASFPEANKRLFSGVWICMSCNAKNRVAPGSKPNKCRKCDSRRLRPKRKVKKKSA